MSQMAAHRQASQIPARTGFWRAFCTPLAVAIACVALWLAVRKVQWGLVAATLRQSDLVLLVLACVSVLATTLVKALRWRVLLKPVAPGVTGMRVLRVLLIGQLGNSLLPARLGDPARAVLIGPRADGGAAAVLGTVAGEKVLDGVLGLCLLVALAIATPFPSWLQRPALILALITGALLAVLGAVSVHADWLSRLAGRSTRWLRPNWQSRVDGALANFREGLGILRLPSIALGALALSIVVWCLAGLTNYITLAVLGIHANFWSVPLVLVASYVANFLPTVPAQVGVFEYACILALGFVGIEQEQALAFGLILHLLVYGPPLVLGPLAMAIEGLSWTTLWRARNERPEVRGVAE